MDEQDRLTAIVDVGAAAFDTPPSYQSMLEAGLCTVTAFDPQQQFAPAARKNLTFIPATIGNGQPAKLHIFSAPGMTSVLMPEWSTLNALSPIAAGGPEWGKLLQISDVETRRLDDIAELAHMDFLRMDAQGAELMILEGATSKLADTVCVQTEASFAQIYVDQPMFGDIHEYLSARGFIFHTFTEFHIRTIGPSRGRGRHIIQADAVYVKDFRNMENWSLSQLRHMATLARWCFGSDDLAYRCTKRMEDLARENNRAGESDDGRDRGSGDVSGRSSRRPIVAGNGVAQRG
jgi:FkbM family methyltransferase